mgnify:CR=1 FL=1
MLKRVFLSSNYNLFNSSSTEIDCCGIGLGKFAGLTVYVNVIVKTCAFGTSYIPFVNAAVDCPSLTSCEIVKYELVVPTETVFGLTPILTAASKSLVITIWKLYTTTVSLRAMAPLSPSFFSPLA